MHQPSIIFKILNHLYERKALDDDFIDITDFLKTIWNENDKIEEFNNLNRINKAISRIQEQQMAYFRTNPGHHILNENKIHPATQQSYRVDLHNTDVHGQFTLKGHDYIKEELRKIKEEESIILSKMTPEEEIEYHILKFFETNEGFRLSMELWNNLDNQGIRYNKKTLEDLFKEGYLDSDRNEGNTHFVYKLNDKGKARINRLENMKSKKEAPSINIGNNSGIVNTGDIGKDQIQNNAAAPTSKKSIFQKIFSWFMEHVIVRWFVAVGASIGALYLVKHYHIFGL